MKRIVYIAAFAILGILLQFLVHALIELWYTALLMADFARYGLGLPWDAWFLIHHIATAVLFVGGVVGGYFSGRYWWRIIYIEKKYEKCRDTHQ